MNMKKFSIYVCTKVSLEKTTEREEEKEVRVRNKSPGIIRCLLPTSCNGPLVHTKDFRHLSQLFEIEFSRSM